MHDADLAFPDRTSHYGDPLFSGRNLKQYELWPGDRAAPVLHMDGERPAAELANQVEAEIPSQRPSRKSTFGLS